MPTMEEWTIKMVELAKMAKLACLIREGTITTFYKRKLFMEFLLKMDKNLLVISRLTG